MTSRTNRRLLEKLGIETCDPPATESSGEDVDPPEASIPLETTDTSFKSLMERANQGDQDAIRKLKQVLDANPHLWKEATNLGRLVEAKLIRRVAGQSVIVAESTKRTIDEWRRELAGDNPPLILALAAERVTTSWLQLQILELEGGPAPADGSSPEGRWRLRHLDQAHRRFLSSLRMLATLRGRPLAEFLGRAPKTQSGAASHQSRGHDATTVPFVRDEE